MWLNYPVTELVGMEFKLRQRLKNLPSCAHILHKALNLVISRCGLAEHDGEMYQKFIMHVQGLCFSHYILLFCDVLVAVAVVAS